MPDRTPPTRPADATARRPFYAFDPIRVIALVALLGVAEAAYLTLWARERLAAIPEIGRALSPEEQAVAEIGDEPGPADSTRQTDPPTTTPTPESGR